MYGKSGGEMPSAVDERHACDMDAQLSGAALMSPLCVRGACIAAGVAAHACVRGYRGRVDMREGS